MPIQSICGQASTTLNVIEIMCGQSSTSPDANQNHFWTVIQVWMPMHVMCGQSSTCPDANPINMYVDSHPSPDANVCNVWTVSHNSGCQSKYSFGSPDVVQIICGHSSTCPDANPIDWWIVIPICGCHPNKLCTVIHVSGCQSN
jgi:hypothetical protein